MKYLVLAFILFNLNVEACYKPKDGYGMSKDALIKSAKIIAIAELVKVEKQGVGFEYTFKTLSNLVGTSEEEIKFYGRFPPVIKSEDFEEHTDDKFWENDIGRSWFPSGTCGPAHTFAFGERYLLFPSLYGATASGENVSSVNDKWLAYVKKNL
ncbi:MAG: hypothetical protein KUG78_19215 [Kangiellaceae bacterium]|nr:hypothetical protein [Kangiellaceae bacterium]